MTRPQAWLSVFRVLAWLRRILYAHQTNKSLSQSDPAWDSLDTDGRSWLAGWLTHAACAFNYVGGHAYEPKQCPIHSRSSSLTAVSAGCRLAFTYTYRRRHQPLVMAKAQNQQMDIRHTRTHTPTFTHANRTERTKKRKHQHKRDKNAYTYSLCLRASALYAYEISPAQQIHRIIIQLGYPNGKRAATTTTTIAHNILPASAQSSGQTDKNAKITSRIVGGDTHTHRDENLMHRRHNKCRVYALCAAHTEIKHSTGARSHCKAADAPNA